MTQFKNEPHMNNENSTNEQKRRFTHQPLTFDHMGIHAKIQVNGKIILSKVARQIPMSDEVEYDEIEIPASLVFELAKALKLTRSVEFVDAKK